MLLCNWILITEFALVYLLGQTESYNMEEVTVAPAGQQALPTYEEVVREVLEFESVRSPTLTPTEIKITYKDAIDLCVLLAKHEDFHGEYFTKQITELIPVQPNGAFSSLPPFHPPCIGWIRKACVGTPRPPFDYRCHFWVPFVTPAMRRDCTHDLPNAGNGDGGDGGELIRKKRLAPDFDSPIVSGLEAASLCATLDIFPEGSDVTLKHVALPLNEGLSLRCINFKRSPEGGWVRHSLSPQACEAMNLRRPEGSVKRAPDAIDDFEDIVKCESRDTLVDCWFVEANVEEMN